MRILRPTMIAVLTVVLLATAPAWAVPNYIAIRLGTIGVETLGASINASGQVAGSSSFDSGPYRAFLFSGGVMQNLGTLAIAGGYSAGCGIDDAGRVVGYTLTVDLANHAFLYSGGAMQDLGTLGGQDSYGYGINANGQVIGIAQADSSGVFHAFFYTGGTMRDLGTLGGKGSWAYGINAKGQVTGSAKVDDFSGYDHAFLYSDGTMQDLGTLGGPNSVGYGINTNGQVIGEADINSSGGFHAFLYSGGNMQDLGTLGGTASSGQGINGSGEAVGLSTASVGGPPRAILYSRGTMYDLNLLVVSGLGGATLVEATAINDSGQIVANTCQHAGPGCAAFRLDPIAGPATVLPTVEFYNVSLDHYFMTSMPSEIAILDAGTQIKGWTRTGYAFKAYTAAQAGTSPACRYYIPPGYGDSHFFSAAPDECAIALVKFPWLFKETDAAFYIALPNTNTGACASNEIPVYRLWNGRADSNHRYTTSTVVKSTMIANGYIAEGYGPDQVDMCAPQ
jgi:probable HAF family extracellular repeat protein